MPSQPASSDVLVIGYGSLMSGLGLQPFGRLRARATHRVALPNTRRGFGKFSQHGDRFAMVLEPVHADQPIEARTLAADTEPSHVPEGVSLLVQPNDFARMCDREGYSSGAVHRLRHEAAASQDLAAFLWSLLAAAGYDIAAFRQRLVQLVGYTSPHYIPHPVRVDGARFGIVFLAPGREGSGSDRVVPVRVRTRNESLMTAPEAWRRKPNRTQLTYFVTCLLGGAHGIWVRDLLTPLADEPGLALRLRSAVAAEQPQELTRFLDMTGIEYTAYWQAFGPPPQGARRSGLEDFLKR
jgi:hypothetical protein